MLQPNCPWPWRHAFAAVLALALGSMACGGSSEATSPTASSTSSGKSNGSATGAGGSSGAIGSGGMGGAIGSGGMGGGAADAGSDAGCSPGLMECSGACVDMTTDNANCGACGVLCTGGTMCVSGACTCPQNEKLCGGVCVDETSDPKNCGACGVTCAPSEVCSMGACKLDCAPGLTACSGACVDLSANPAHCGQCATVCPVPPGATSTCSNGLCGYACSGTFKDCNLMAQDGCEVDAKSDVANCGACNSACPSGPQSQPLCAGGICAIVCAPGFADCNMNAADGCETDLASVLSCGMCGVVCSAGPNATAACMGGLCVAPCNAGYSDCNGNPADGCEVTPSSDVANCGACANACPVPAHSAATCNAGVCGYTCLGGYLDCDLLAANGCEIDGQNDVSHCGACANACSLFHATPMCTAGGCAISSCDLDYTDCDLVPANGCEQDTAFDPTSCGGCGWACEATNVSMKSCAVGKCNPQCSGTYGDCNGPTAGNADDGCETNLATDLHNCGVCGKNCGANEKCCAGGCFDTTNCTLSVSAALPAVGFQNGGAYVTITGAGFGAGVKVLFDDGVAPAWAKDSQTIIALTPPHPTGTVDIKVIQGANTAILHGAFTYFKKALQPPWQQKPMSKVRGEMPAIAVMQNGKAIVAGGTTTPDNSGLTLNTAEIYDRSTDLVTLSGNGMSSTRWHDQAITLLTGKVLVVGGCSGCAGGNDKSGDLYDPDTNLFTATPLMSVARNFIRGALMPDGRVFITSSGVGTVEIYDPIANTFSTIAHATVHTYGFTVRLRDGRIMFGGGNGGVTSVEIYDPVANTFSNTGSLNTGRSMVTAHTLPDGRVIVVGGCNVSAGAVNAPQTTMETWNPATGLWSYTPQNLVSGRCWHASALLRDGTVLVMGGYPTNGSCTPTKTVEQYDPLAGALIPNFPSLINPNTEWNAVTLLDGSVLGVGGGACGAANANPDLDFFAGAL